MKTYQTIQLRAFDVRMRDERTGEEMEDVVVLTKSQLQAAQIVGQSSKELIHRLCSAQGYKVLGIGRAERLEAELDLYRLYQEEAGD